MATYYVRTDGNNSNAGTSNTAGGAWLTISKAATSVTVAGDVVRVQAGTYNETVTPTRNGSAGAGNTITFIADGTVYLNRAAFNNNSYLRFIGFNFNPSVAGGGTAGDIITFTNTSTGIEFWHNSIGPSDNNGISIAHLSNGYNSSIFVGNTIHDIAPNSGQYATAMHMFGNNNFVGYNEISNVCYIVLGPSGSENRYTNNYIHGMRQDVTSGTHPDFVYFSVGEGTVGSTHLLYQNNLCIGTPTASDNKWFHAQNDSSVSWTNNVWRGNVTYNLGSGIFSFYGAVGGGQTGTGYIVGSRFYNNTHTYAERAHTSDLFSNAFGSTNGTHTNLYDYNDIFYQTWAEASYANQVYDWGLANGATLSGANYNLAYSPTATVAMQSPWTLQANAIANQDPLLTSIGTDWRLSSTSSPAYHAGGPLTHTVGSGTGTTFNVTADTAAFFYGSNSSNLPQYSGLLVPGDTITIGSTTRTISSISGDAITVTSSFTWANGDPVYYGSSANVDIGAFPYGSSTLTAATISNVGTTYTVTPTGSCRGVWFYVDGIPTTYTETAPYQATIASGAVIAKAYALYAQSTPVVTATQSSSFRLGFRLRQV